jgi:hypothetical protein
MSHSLFDGDLTPSRSYLFGDVYMWLDHHLLFYVLLVHCLEDNVSLLLPRQDVECDIGYYYFIVDEDGAKSYVRVCSLHHFSWLDL